jgi:hypothetical protein
VALDLQYCSIYDPYFWRHERLWKVPGEVYLHTFDGTPFKNLVWRGLGVRIGKRVFDDGCYLTERTLTTIGDDCMLNAGSRGPGDQGLSARVPQLESRGRLPSLPPRGPRRQRRRHPRARKPSAVMTITNTRMMIIRDL